MDSSASHTSSDVSIVTVVIYLMALCEIDLYSFHHTKARDMEVLQLLMLAHAEVADLGPITHAHTSLATQTHLLCSTSCQGVDLLESIMQGLHLVLVSTHN